MTRRQFSPDPADRGGVTKPNFSDDPDALNQPQGKTNPDVAGALGVTGNAKMPGGGFEPGTTGFGPSTASTQGGRGGVGAGGMSGGNARTTTGGTGGSDVSPAGGSAGPVDEAPGMGEGMTGANGNSVTATGRPMMGDTRRGTGSAALSGTNVTPQQESGNLQPGGTARSAADPSGVGTIGGGTAGTGATRASNRTLDITEGRSAGPEHNLAGGNVAPDERAETDPDRQTPSGTPPGWNRARQQSPSQTQPPRNP